MKYLILIVLIFNSNLSFARSVKTIKLNEKSVARVLISPRGSVLSFPEKPKKVVLGKNGAFKVEYVENDLAVSPKASNSRSNVFIYLNGRRFTFDLVTSVSHGHTLILVRDKEDMVMRVKQ